MWTRFQVRWEFLTNLCASVPADPEMIRKWLESRKPKTRPPQSRSIDEIATEVAATLLRETEPERSLLVFQRIEGHLAVRAATIRAHMKDVARVLSSLYIGKLETERSFAVRVANAVYWPPEAYWVPILDREGRPVTEASGTFERPVHAQTPRGPISALKEFEFVRDAVMEFQLLVLTTPDRTVEKKVVPGKPIVSEADLKTLFTYGGVHGYGGERSYDGGRYVFTITQVYEEVVHG